MKPEIINLIRRNLLEIIPDLEGKEISNDDTLTDLGANSIDRGELITLTLERLDYDISRIEFVGVQTINELADLISKKRML
ncbi:acyl carrier protein [Aquimarina sp. RZ0]|uniref:acyl carrier protein n=1 Tax=Aquimarina sp. RZ0 TaxID=2607730 RepID=UPI0011F34CF5|nr:acyl carrier protein [Aquimarina sp. RZ0]KAA1246067.1 acyl carrier protein [Aquimarina sp. RZ0]